MTDAYVYYFKGWIMESQLVVDRSELDENGFLITGAVNDLSFQIGSLERRAASRDGEASKLNDGDEGRDKYMLSLESRELRNQARKLNEQIEKCQTAKAAGANV
jgi:hypothetical protein